jgi:outer membrane receptor protein involved in Fe transport
LKKSKLVNSIAIALGASVLAPVANAQLEEIIVTATKRAESSQDIPVAIQAIGADALDELGVSTFDEYVKYLPNVTQQGRGPGRSEIYIRGVASEQSNNTVSSVQGSAPTVAVYLDEQPAAFGGRNLDIYAADLERVEVLPGPQGTLFGASSQAGTVRLITKKPSTDSFDASVKAGYSFTTGGDPSNSLEAAINIPLTDKLAVRGVVYSDTQGGWIDNTASSFGNVDQRSLVAAFNRNQAFASVSDDAIVTPTNNGSLVEDNWNDAQYTGVRLGLSYDFNEDWSLLVQHTSQDLETEGSFEYVAATGTNDNSQSFSPERNNDDFGLTSWTVEGRLGALDVIYTGGFLNRDVNSVLDYTLYSFTGGYQNYYISTNNRGSGQDTIFDQRKQYLDNTGSDRLTHELRFQGEIGEKFQFTTGVFFDDVETNSVGQFQYFGALGAGIDTGVRPAGLPDGINNPNARDRPTIFVNDFTRKEEQTAIFADFTFDLTETLSVSAGARYYDLDFGFRGATGGSFGGCQNGPDISTLPVVGAGQLPNGASAILRPDGTLGCTGGSGNNVTARLQALGGGTAESIRGFFGGGTEALLADIAAGNIAIDSLDDSGTSNQSDTIYRVTVDWKAADDVLLFATVSEGFRPQTVNRNAGSAASNQSGPFAGFRVPAVVQTDELSNFEVGIKGDFLDSRLRLNATYFNSEIKNLQATRFDPANIGILVFLENVGDAEVQGVDADFTWVPTDNLTIQGAVSLVDSEITRLNGPLQGVSAPVGSELPFTADFSFNVRSRYDFALESFGADAYVSAGLIYTGDSFANVTADANFIEDQTRRLYGRGSGLQIQNYAGTFGASATATAIPGSFGTIDTPNGEFFQAGRYIQESYSVVNVSTGLNKDNWGVELYVNNLLDEDGIVNINTFDGTPKVSVTRPRTVGVRFNWDFN